MCIRTELTRCIAGVGFFFKSIFIVFFSWETSYFVESFIFFIISFLICFSFPIVLCLLTSFTLKMINPSCCVYLQPKIEGLTGGAFTMLNLIIMDLFLIVILRWTALMFAIFDYPYPFRIVWIFLIFGPKCNHYTRSNVCMFAPVSALIFSLERPFVVISVYTSSGYLETGWIFLLDLTVPMQLDVRSMISPSERFLYVRLSSWPWISWSCYVCKFMCNILSFRSICTVLTLLCAGCFGVCPYICSRSCLLFHEGFAVLCASCPYLE